MKLTKSKEATKVKVSFTKNLNISRVLENAKKEMERRHSHGIEKMCCDIIPWKMYVSWH